MENAENLEPTESTEAIDSTANGVSSIAAKAEQKVRVLRETARTEAGQRVQELGGKAQERIDLQRDRVASRIEDAATRLRERGDAAGTIGHMAGEQVATRMESAAGYLHERHTDEIAGDLAGYVKQHPIQSIVAAACLGYVFGRISG
jgi:ElaB/YqjD/DUF883 family membrane-anchored ribosome-binding protein